MRATVRQGVVRPRWVDPDDAALAEGVAALVALYQAHVGRQTGALEDALTELTLTRPDPILWKGLAKLLDDRTVTETRAPVPPATLRAKVFAEAGARWPIGPASREAALAAAAEALGIAVAEVEVGLYADRPSEQWITAVDTPAPDALLRDYNVALAQAALLRAREVRVELTDLEAKRARAVLRELKFRRLLARVEGEAGRWRLTLDGPLSLFKQTTRYGVQLALFLPALVRCPAWKLEADVTWGKGNRPATLVLSDASPLVVPAGHHDDGTWVSAEEQHFQRGFEALASAWTLAPSAVLVDLDGHDVLAPDYLLKHADGREVLVEIVWAWRRQGFVKRLERLRAAAPPNLIVLWAERGGHDAEGAAEVEARVALPGLLRFKGVIPPKKVVELAERLAVRPSAPKRRAKRD